MTTERCTDSKPTAVGKYCVVIDGVRSMLPLYMSFDGTDWQWAAVDSNLRNWGLDRTAVRWFPPVTTPDPAPPTPTPTP